jgi:hypothetical protein
MLNKAVRENRQRAIAEERKRQSQIKAAELAEKKVPVLQKCSYIYPLIIYC